MNSIAAPIVVVVPDDDDDTAVRFATREAAIHGCGLRLVHTYAPTWVGPPQAAAADRLERAVRRAESLVEPGTEVTGLLVRGDPVGAVLDSSPDARAIVVPHQEVLRLVQALTQPGSRRARPVEVPVVCLPGGWRPSPSSRSVVTVGVEVPARSADLLRQALIIAREHRASLRIVHTWSFPEPYDHRIERWVGADWTARSRAELENVLTSLPASRDVTIEIDVRHGRPEPALFDAARDSEVLVLAPDDAHESTARRLGRIVRAALHASTCPVVLLPAVRRLPQHQTVDAEPLVPRPRDRRTSPAPSAEATVESWTPRHTVS